MPPGQWLSGIVVWAEPLRLSGPVSLLKWGSQPHKMR